MSFRYSTTDANCSMKDRATISICSAITEFIKSVVVFSCFYTRVCFVFVEKISFVQNDAAVSCQLHNYIIS